MRKELGKILDVKFGCGGYGDGMIGIEFTLSGSWGEVCDFWGYWSGEVTEYTKWTDEERKLYLGEVLMKIQKILDQCDVFYINDLKNKPVEITFDGNCLKEWRILTEVI